MCLFERRSISSWSSSKRDSNSSNSAETRRRCLLQVVQRAALGNVPIDVFHNDLHHVSSISASFKAHSHSSCRGRCFVQVTWKRRNSSLAIQCVRSTKNCKDFRTPNTFGPSTTSASFIRVYSNALVIHYVTGRVLRTVKKVNGIQTIPMRLRKKDVVVFTAVHYPRGDRALINMYCLGMQLLQGMSTNHPQLSCHVVLANEERFILLLEAQECSWRRQYAISCSCKVH